MRRTAALLALAALAAAAPASANFGQALGSPTIVFTGGSLIPQERELDPGVHFGVAWLYNTSFGASIGVEGTYSLSTDPLRTHFSAISFHGRLGPDAESNLAFLVMGVGAYAVGYNPKDEALSAPPTLVRPGASFGVGFEFASFGNMTVGASGVYHGVLLHRGDALAFVQVSATLTWRASPF